MIVYISIGNSDDNLSQKEWSDYWHEVNNLMAGMRIKFHGRWTSNTHDEYQNACWCVEFNAVDSWIDYLKSRLGGIAEKHRQDSIAWAVVKDTEFIRSV